MLFSCRPLGSMWNKKYAGSLEEAPVCVDSMFQNRFLSSMHVAQVNCQSHLTRTRLTTPEHRSPLRTDRYSLVRQDQQIQESPPFLHLARRRHHSPRRPPPTNHDHNHQRLMLAIHICHALDGDGSHVRHAGSVTSSAGCRHHGHMELAKDKDWSVGVSLAISNAGVDWFGTWYEEHDYGSQGFGGGFGVDWEYYGEGQGYGDGDFKDGWGATYVWWGEYVEGFPCEVVKVVLELLALSVSFVSIIFKNILSMHTTDHTACRWHTNPP